MSTRYNHVELVGFVGTELSVLDEGTNKERCSFQLGVSKTWKVDPTNPQSDWFRVTVFGKMAQSVSKRIHKGDCVLVDGEVHVNQYETKSGEKRTSCEVSASNIIFLRSPEKVNQNGIKAGPVSATVQEPDLYDNDIPF